MPVLAAQSVNAGSAGGGDSGTVEYTGSMTRVPCAALGGKWEKPQHHAFVLKLNTGPAEVDAQDVFLRGAAAFRKREGGAAVAAEGKFDSVMESKDSESARSRVAAEVGATDFEVVDGSLELPEAMAIAHIVGVRNNATQGITFFVRDIAIGAWV